MLDLVYITLTYLGRKASVTFYSIKYVSRASDVSNDESKLYVTGFLLKVIKYEGYPSLRPVGTVSEETRSGILIRVICVGREFGVVGTVVAYIGQSVAFEVSGRRANAIATPQKLGFAFSHRVLEGIVTYVALLLVNGL